MYAHKPTCNHTMGDTANILFTWWLHEKAILVAFHKFPVMNVVYADLSEFHVIRIMCGFIL